MRIAITGACGFIGSWIAKELAKDHCIIALDDCSGGHLSNLIPVPHDTIGIYPAPHFKTEEMDIYTDLDLRIIEDVDPIFDFYGPEVIYHLAANAREGASFFQPISVVTRNLQAYVNTLTAGIKYGMKRMVLFSSMAVYGDQHPPFVEDMPRRPVDVYGLAKMAMEELTEMLAKSHGFEYVILRPHNVFGPYQALNDIHRNVLGIWMNQIMRNEPLTIYGDGSQMRAFSYIEDSLPAYIEAMNAPSGHVFNIGSDYPLKIIDAARTIIEAMGVGQDYPMEYLPDRHGEVKFAYTDHTKAKQVLGLKDTGPIEFEEGVAEMARWAMRQGPQEWRNSDPLEIPNQLTPSQWTE